MLNKLVKFHHFNLIFRSKRLEERRPVFSWSRISHDDKRVRHYTRFPSYAVLEAFFDRFVKPDATNLVLCTGKMESKQAVRKRR
jgi:hypothetical protein